MQKNIICVDIETSSLNRLYGGILSIGAVKFETGEEFYVECVIPADSSIDQNALNINGFKAEEIVESSINHPDKPTQKEAVYKFVEWCGSDVLLCGQNIGCFDVLFLHRVYDGTFDMTWPLGRRFLDLSSMAFQKFGESYSMKSICDKCKVEERQNDVHNALQDARLVRECLKALLRKE